MEDEKIKVLFSNFQPELSSSYKFMETLQKKMEAMEAVKQYAASLRRRNRVAVIAASLGGFVSGVIVTLMMPLILSWLSSLSICLPDLRIADMQIDNSIIGLLMAAGTSILTALAIYDLTASRPAGMKRAPAR